MASKQACLVLKGRLRNCGRVVSINRIFESHSRSLRGHPVVNVVHAAVPVAVPSNVDDGEDERGDGDGDQAEHADADGHRVEGRASVFAVGRSESEGHLVGVEVVFGVAREAGGRDFVEGKALQFGGAVADEFLDEI